MNIIDIYIQNPYLDQEREEREYCVWKSERERARERERKWG